MLVRALALAVLLAAPAGALDHTRVAFPGATGWGAYTLEGWPTTPSVCRVLNTNDSGAGSVRDCVGADNRIVTCDGIYGTVTLATSLALSHHHVLLNLMNCNIQFTRSLSYGGGSERLINVTGDHTAILGIRCRDSVPSIASGNGDCLDIDEAADDTIISNSSFAWGSDEILDTGGASHTNGPHRATVMNSIIGDALSDGVTPGYCVLDNATDTTFTRNLIACAQRLAHPQGGGTAEVRENILYSTQDAAPAQAADCDGDENHPLTTVFINNAFMRSSLVPSTNAHTIINYLQTGCATNTPANEGCDGQSVYVRGNTSELIVGEDDAQQAPLLLCRNQTQGCTNNAHVLTVCTNGDDQARIVNEPATNRLLPEIDLDEGLVPYVLAHAGHPIRDSVDNCIVNWVNTDTGTTQLVTPGANRVAVTGGCGPIDTMTAMTPCVDGDTDGLCDSFEAQYGVSSATADDDADGFLNIEEQLNHTHPLVDEQHGDTVDTGPFAGSTMRVQLANDGCTVPCEIDVTCEFQAKRPPGSVQYGVDFGEATPIVVSPISAGNTEDRLTRSYTFSGAHSYTVAGTYPITCTALQGGLKPVAQNSKNATVISGSNPTISSVTFTTPGTVANSCVQPCSSTTIGGLGASDNNITWRADINPKDCTGVEAADNACYETALGTTTGPGTQSFIGVDLPDFPAAGIGQQTFRISAKDAGGQAFYLASITVDQQIVFFTGGGPTFSPPGGCEQTTDCAAVTITVGSRDTCPGNTTTIAADDDTTPFAGGDSEVNQASPANVVLGPFNLDGVSPSPTFPLSVGLRCGSADDMIQQLTYSVSAVPQAATFGITGDAPQFLNDSILTPATLLDACINFTGTETGQVTAIEAHLTLPDTTTISLITGGASETECVDEGTGDPVPCPERFCLSDGGFTPLQLTDAVTYSLDWTATRGAKVRTASPDFTLQTPQNTIGDLTSNCGDPNASLFFTSEDGGPNPSPQSCTFTSLNANPVTFTLTQTQPYVGWVTQLTASNGTCTGANSCTCATPCTITWVVQDAEGTLPNQPPTGVSVNNFAIQLPTNSQALDCSATGSVTDPEGDPIVFAWSSSGTGCGTFSNAAIEAPTMTGLTEGSCTVACAATDPSPPGSGGVVTDTGLITIAAAGGGGGGTDWTADSHCRAFYDFEAGLTDGCDDGGNSDDLTATAGPVYVTTDKPTGVGAGFRWVNCTGTTLLTTSTTASDRLQDNEFTIFAVLRTTASIVSKSIIGNWLTANGTNSGWRLATLSSGVWRMYSSVAYSGTSKPTATTIHTISYSFDRNAAGHGQKLYMDGQLDPNFAQYTDGGSSNVVNGTGELQICGYDGTGSFDGYISDVLYLGGSGAWLDATQHNDLCRFGPKGPNGWSDRSAQCD